MPPPACGAFPVRAAPRFVRRVVWAAGRETCLRPRQLFACPLTLTSATNPHRFCHDDARFAWAERHVRR